MCRHRRAKGALTAVTPWLVVASWLLFCSTEARKFENPTKAGGVRRLVLSVITTNSSSGLIQSWLRARQIGLQFDMSCPQSPYTRLTCVALECACEPEQRQPKLQRVAPFITYE